MAFSGALTLFKIIILFILVLFWPDYTLMMDSDPDFNSAASSAASEVDLTPRRGDTDGEPQTQSPSPIVTNSSNRHVRRLFDDEESYPLGSLTHSAPIRPPSRRPIRTADESGMDAVLKELREANTRLKDVTNRLDNVEGRLKGLEEASACSTSTGSDEPSLKKRKIPPQVRVSHKLYLAYF